MKYLHLVICDLFLPENIAAGICAGLRLPALEKMLAHGAWEGSVQAVGGTALEELLCEMFTVPHQPTVQVASVSAAFDGLGAGLWMRADPVHLHLQRDQLVLLPDLDTGADEAAKLCADLSNYFSEQGMAFFAPHPQRWYMRLEQQPDIETVPLSQAAGRNVRDLLPGGAEAKHWHRVLNEIQMFLFAHPVNAAREARGELPVSSLWLWGGGSGTLPPAQPAIRPGEPAMHAALQKNYDCIGSDDVLAGMFAAVAGIPFSGWPEQWRSDERGDRQLLVWTGLRSALQHGDPDVWRAALQAFETGYAQPLWQALRAGKITRLQIDILGGGCVRRLVLNRADAWAFWRRTKPLEEYTI